MLFSPPPHPPSLFLLPSSLPGCEVYGAYNHLVLTFIVFQFEAITTLCS